MPVQPVRPVVLRVVGEVLDMDPSAIDPSARFAEDFGVDSIALLNIFQVLEDELEVELPTHEVEGLTSLDELISYVEGHDGTQQDTVPQASRRPFLGLQALLMRSLLPLWCRRLPLVVEGTLPAGPCVVAPVHRSAVDPFLVAHGCSRPMRFMAKASLWERRLVGSLLSKLGAFPVRRGIPDREAISFALGALEVGESVLVFPEGTRQTGPRVAGLKQGAAQIALRAGVPLVPVAIWGSDQVLPPGNWWPRRHPVQLRIGAPVPRSTTAAPDVAAVMVSLTEALNELLAGLAPATSFSASKA